MNIQETEAVILQTRDYGESDRLITFYTRVGGKLRGIAKGARRSRKRFVHAFEPCSLVQLTYRERRSLVWVEACKLLEPHLALRADVDRWGYAALLSEFFLEMVPEGELQDELFLLLREALHQLSADKDPLNAVLLFAFRFLDTMGYLPSLESCSTCGRPLREATRWWWQMNRGRLLCSEHRSPYDEYLSLDLGTLMLIRQLRQMPMDRVWRLRFSQEKKAGLFHALMDWIRGHIRKELKSLKLLEQVQLMDSIAAS